MKHNPPSKEKNLNDWQAPVIFKTSDFFGPRSTGEQSTHGAQDSTQDTMELSADDKTEDSTAQTTDR